METEQILPIYLPLEVRTDPSAGMEGRPHSGTKLPTGYRDYHDIIEDMLYKVRLRDGVGYISWGRRKSKRENAFQSCVQE